MNAHKFSTVCEICGKPKSGYLPGGVRITHEACSKAKQKLGTFKEKRLTPSRHAHLMQSYEFLVNRINQGSVPLGDRI